MAKKTLTILVEVEDGKPEIHITDDAENKKVLEGLFLVGYGPHTQDFYMFGIGDHWSTARAFGEGLARSIDQEKARGDGWYVAFYKSLLAELMLRTGTRPAHQQETTAKEIKEKWDGEDAAKEEARKKLN